MEVIGGFFQNGQPIRPDCLFSIWPAGTGCDFYRGQLQADSFKNRAPGSITAIDIGRVTYMNHKQVPEQRYFLNIVSCGISALVNQLMDQKWKRLGRVGFYLNTVESLVRYSNRRVRIKTDQGDMGERNVRLVAIGNGKYFGGGMKITPDAQLDDGKFQLVLLGDLSLVDALIHSPQLYTGQHLSHPKVETRDVTWAEITSDQLVLIDLDGESPGTLPLRIQIIPASVRLKTY